MGYLRNEIEYFFNKQYKFSIIFYELQEKTKNQKDSSIIYQEKDFKVKFKRLEYDTYQNSYCGICYERNNKYYPDDIQESGTKMIVCYGCNQTCHLYCYGLDTPIQEEIFDEKKTKQVQVIQYFVCQKCQHEISPNKFPDCFLCNEKKGILKLIENERNNEWVHINCGLFNKGQIFVKCYRKMTFIKQNVIKANDNKKNQNTCRCCKSDTSLMKSFNVLKKFNIDDSQQDVLKGGLVEIQCPKHQKELKYCVCQALLGDSLMIQCDLCDEWYHCQCINMKHTEVDNMDKFRCSLCNDCYKYTLCDLILMMIYVDIKFKTDNNMQEMNDVLCQIPLVSTQIEYCQRIMSILTCYEELKSTWVAIVSNFDQLNVRPIQIQDQQESKKNENEKKNIVSDEDREQAQKKLLKMLSDIDKNSIQNNSENVKTLENQLFGDFYKDRNLYLQEVESYLTFFQIIEKYPLVKKKYFRSQFNIKFIDYLKKNPDKLQIQEEQINKKIQSKQEKMHRKSSSIELQTDNTPSSNKSDKYLTKQNQKLNNLQQNYNEQNSDLSLEKKKKLTQRIPNKTNKQFIKRTQKNYLQENKLKNVDPSYISKQTLQNDQQNKNKSLQVTNKNNQSLKRTKEFILKNSDLDKKNNNSTQIIDSQIQQKQRICKQEQQNKQLYNKSSKKDQINNQSIAKNQTTQNVNKQLNQIHSNDNLLFTTKLKLKNKCFIIQFYSKEKIQDSLLKKIKPLIIDGRCTRRNKIKQKQNEIVLLLINLNK
ncbi:hypothetical protein IMG5_165450 [Ichthyophthirius multifiliis]|uniref:PHD-type domain-containing protein n=1 Tax=Ichthyophthirius multifiliis TaxID=5932 RepID=G0R0L4_ICHMU|nr:hypothetical protein IMG5_165450 [Ichthyophthirius multifiliis]EGR29000.1 hypothetical protein IMG5_165450 [Ichthyophthirius multifiliis]|eukprot:XP_004030236.1 hypothetical protein IMG5_165450 [Ichthyophthirius multifiliis]